MKELAFVIPANPATKKNSQNIVRGKNGKPIIVQNKRYKEYEKACKEYVPKLPEPIDYPVEVSCLYYRKDNRRCDLTNLLAATTDILVKYGVLADDNCKIIASVDGSRVFVDKTMPRTVIRIVEIGGEDAKN